jgi:hypothetical protein
MLRAELPVQSTSTWYGDEDMAERSIEST